MTKKEAYIYLIKNWEHSTKEELVAATGLPWGAISRMGSMLNKKIGTRLTKKNNNTNFWNDALIAELKSIAF